MPHHRYLSDGRLLTWYHRAGDDDVCGFQLTVNADVGVGPIGTDIGIALLAAEGVGLDGNPKA